MAGTLRTYGREPSLGSRAAVTGRAAVMMAAALTASCLVYPFPTYEQRYYGADTCPPEEEESEEFPSSESQGQSTGFMMWVPDGDGAGSVQPIAQAPPPRCARCDQVVIRLPSRIEFHGRPKRLRLEVCTRLQPGDYRIRYLPGSQTFDIAPQEGKPSWTPGDEVLEVVMDDRPETRELYKAYLDSMRGYVPLKVRGKPTPHAVCPSEQPAEPVMGKATERLVGMLQGKLRARKPLSRIEAGTLADMALADADAGERAGRGAWLAWTQFAQDNSESLRSKDALSGEEMRELLSEYRKQTGQPSRQARTTAEVMGEKRRREAWNCLPERERELWNAYIQTYGNTADVTVSEDLRITDQVKLGMALRIMPKYLRSGGSEALHALVNDPAFQMATVIGITAYLALLVAPEPLLTKGMAVLTTVGIISMCGATVGEIITLAQGWMQLREDTEQASTLTEIEAAAAAFGRALGGSGARLLVAVATIVAGQALGGKPVRSMSTPPPGVPVMASGRGVVASVVGLELRLVTGPAVELVAVPLAMAAVKGSGASGSGRGAGKGGKRASASKPPREPGKWVPSKTHMSPRAAKYQQQITGRPVTEEYLVRGVKFDGYKNGVLLEAKGPGYKNFVDKSSNYGKWSWWYEGKGLKGLIDEAAGQVDAVRKADGVPIEWHVAEKEMLPLFQRVIQAAGANDYIVLKHVPAKQ